MLRRAKQTADPLSAQSRTLAVTSAGDLETLKSDFQSDKAIQDGKLTTLEADKADKDTRVSALETDKINKDTQMTALDTRVTTMEDSATGIVDGGRADVQHLEATDIDGGSAAI